MAIKRYSKNEPKVLLFIIVPYQIALNLIYFGQCSISSIETFAKNLLVNGLFFSLIYFTFGIAAVRLRNLYPANADLFKRIGVMLPVFYALNFLTMGALLLFHQNVRILDCPILPQRYGWAVLYGCIMSTFITLMNEVLTNLDSWKESLSETERLKNAYQRSRLLGLKGQINPHFLFNCFNTLSGLIHEDGEEAEVFLEEMTKVHRYLLRGDDELLVPLEEELRFARSYLYLAQVRFGQGIDATINVQGTAVKRWLPPLSMHVILENIIYTNAINKNNPLTIYIKDEAGKLQVHHTIHEKAMSESLGVDEGLDNLVNKFRLLNAPPISISEALGNRMIVLPLLQKNTVQYEAV